MKAKKKTQLEDLKNKYISTIYGGFVKGKSKTDIHKELYKITINSKVKSDFLYKKAVQTLTNIDKKLPKSEEKQVNLYEKTLNEYKYEGAGGLVSVIVASLLDKGHVNQQMEQSIYRDLVKTESEAKDDILKNVFEHNRSLVNPKVFYLASQHNDSAKDHEPYQGKIYIDENWEQYVLDKNLKLAIKYYVNRHRVKTIQWVTAKPVWFITRPNCRHYFKDIDTMQVLEMSRQDLIEKYDMHKKIGERKYLQTLKHKTNKKWYEDVRNAESILRKYKERLVYHKILYNVKRNDLLKNAIHKDKMLINKWVEYLKSRK